jgi:peptidoglycan/LPS O-acetylase OafA/YrhL
VTPSERIRALCEGGRIPVLDGYRAVAVLLVIAYHFGHSWVPGGLGVLMFFVLSGFLITWLLLREEDLRGRVALGRFYAHRALRIFPAFYAYWLVGLAYLLVRGVEVPWGHAGSALLYVSNYYDGVVRPGESFVSHTWSLAIEEQFYLLWPGLVVLLRGRRRLLLAVVVGIILGAWALRAGLRLGLDVHQAYVYRAFETRADHLMIGCLLAIVLRRRLASRLLDRLCAQPWQPVATICLLAVSASLNRLLGADYRDLVGFSVDPVLTAILIVQLLAFHERVPWRWLDLRPMVFLGSISYAMYLYHQLAVSPATRLGAGLPWPVGLALVVGLTVAAAYASRVLVEQPFLRLKSRVGREPAPAEARPPAALTPAAAPRAPGPSGRRTGARRPRACARP